MKIMLIDDNESIIKVIKEVIESAGYECIDFLDPKKAIETFKVSRIDVVLTDLKMPGMSGLEVLQEVKNLSPLTPVIIMTGYADEDSIIDALNMGAIRFYRKPLNIKDLISFLSKIEKNGLKSNLIQLSGDSISEISQKIIEDYKKISGKLDD